MPSSSASWRSRTRCGESPISQGRRRTSRLSQRLAGSRISATSASSASSLEKMGPPGGESVYRARARSVLSAGFLTPCKTEEADRNTAMTVCGQESWNSGTGGPSILSGLRPGRRSAEPTLRSRLLRLKPGLQVLLSGREPLNDTTFGRESNEATLAASGNDRLRDSQRAQTIDEDEEMERVAMMLQRDQLLRTRGIVDMVHHLLDGTPGVMPSGGAPAQPGPIKRSVPIALGQAAPANIYFYFIDNLTKEYDMAKGLAVLEIHICPVTQGHLWQCGQMVDVSS
ncbi:unnamed protein product [Protopolystoma xenopodis]|uniref:Uncharacterized protein n=1 Tax=Protopolystoma xenopodis TaxID=117903 RepID=A0A3S4ZYK8_9PLAT|nr:unnamed protein product [Protopolystoma xenopodis]